jgi:hypothetical protein
MYSAICESVCASGIMNGALFRFSPFVNSNFSCPLQEEKKAIMKSNGQTCV